MRVDWQIPTTRPAYKVFTRLYDKGVNDAMIARALGVDYTVIWRMKQPKNKKTLGKDGFIDFKYHSLLIGLGKKHGAKLKPEHFIDA